ncbi:hypothetical protein PV11_02467 [Exophiala sideris]|uniref:CENP-V/GFA domain-containing protein n=1 Tax=Exophiala sideris TaxID=1016849 RepID=A0A0D1WDL9_9EURO|nr:hypothetical protein PV11_02467 [Exophiala sideris]
MTVPATAFILNSGTLKTVKTQHMDEGFDFALSFCEDCGSPIYAEAQFLPDKRIIQVGTLDDEEYLQQIPAAELNVNHRLHWIKPVDNAGQREKYV